MKSPTVITVRILRFGKNQSKLEFLYQEYKNILKHETNCCYTREYGPRSEECKF